MIPSRPCLHYGMLAHRPTLPGGQEDVYIALDTGEIYVSNPTRTAWLLIGVKEAGLVVYDPTDPGVWSPVPDNVGDALDQAADRLAALESIPEPPAPATQRNLIPNPYFEVWRNGTSSPPQFWSPFGAGAQITRSTSSYIGQYSVRLTRNGANAQAFLNLRLIYPGNFFPGRTFTYGAWVRSDRVNNARLFINDGVLFTATDFHPGDDEWHFLSLTRTLATAPSALQIGVQNQNSDGDVLVDGVVLIEGDRIDRDGFSSYLIRNDLPSFVEVRHDLSVVTSGAAISRSFVAALPSVGPLSRQDPAAVGDSFAQDFFLRGGTYTFVVSGREGTSRGIVQWLLDEVSIGSQDWYAGANAGAVKTISPVTVNGDGYHRIRGTITGRNASSSNWFMELARYSFTLNTLGDPAPTAY